MHRLCQSRSFWYGWGQGKTWKDRIGMPVGEAERYIHTAFLFYDSFRIVYYRVKKKGMAAFSSCFARCMGRSG